MALAGCRQAVLGLGTRRNPSSTGLLFANDSGYVIHHRYQDRSRDVRGGKPTETSQMSGPGGREQAGEQWRVTSNGLVSRVG